MGSIKIEKLLDKYIHAETTLEEEKKLKTYFTSANVAPHLQEYRILFAYFEYSKKDIFTKTIELEPKKNKNYRQWLLVAASVSLMFSLFIGNKKFQENQQRKQLAQITTALQLVSLNLNKGNEALAYLNTYEKTVNKITNIIE